MLRHAAGYLGVGSMRTKIRALSITLVSGALVLAGLQPAQADTERLVYVAMAGGTKITALGTTVSSDLTAQSSIFGARTPASESNKVLNVFASGLASVRTVNTEVHATASGDGFRTVSYARTAGVSLLNGLIKVDAVETTSTVEGNSTSEPSASSSTELIGLEIAGEQYPVNLPKNTGISIPGVATVVVNFQQTGVDGSTVGAQGAGLVVTLLKARGEIAAGAEIILNPTFTMIGPSEAVGGKPLGGIGYALEVNAHVGDEVSAETGYLGAQSMPLTGTNGEVLSNATARVSVNGILRASAVESTVYGVSAPGFAESKVTNELADVRLFPTLFGGLITAEAIGTTARVRVDETGVVREGSLSLVRLRIAGQAIPVDVAPNTTIDVARLGTVTINKQDEFTFPGVGNIYQVIGLEIVLDTARAGLPVGAVVRVGVAQAIVYG